MTETHQTILPQLKVIEATDDVDIAFEQKTHTMMVKGIDRVAEGWINELAAIIRQVDDIKAMIIAESGRSKDSVTRMHLLGVQTRKLVETNRQVIGRITDELDQLMKERQV